MQIFFSSIDTLNQYSLSLNALAANHPCQHCTQSNQWVSHGYVYKQISSTQRQIVGKRILCSRRYGKRGCGRSRQLYQQYAVPHRHYLLQTFITFILLLINGMGVVQAYRNATQRPTVEARQAWRWLNTLTSKLGKFRSVLNQRPEMDQPHFHSRRLTLLLSTLQRLIPTTIDGLQFQHRYQQPIA